MVKTVSDVFNENACSANKSDLFSILCGFLNCDRAALLLKKDTALSEDEYNILKEQIELSKTGMPVAYITGRKEFYSLTFEVTPDVLIPRPDTETIVEFALRYAKGKKVLDLCAGSGCIGLSVAYYSQCDITLADISEKALKVARRNAENLKINAEFLKTDILNDDIDGVYDMILSNPPYIETSVIPTLDKSVYGFEPHEALDGGADGLMFYPVIAKKASSALTGDGVLAVETGHTQAKAVKKMFESRFEETIVLKDLAGIERVVIGKRPRNYI